VRKLLLLFALIFLLVPIAALAQEKQAVEGKDDIEIFATLWRIAVLPIGYADGYDRKLSKIAQVLWKGCRLPVIGGLCMDAAFIKITDYPAVKIGDAVTLMGVDGAEEISPHEIASLIGSVSYEVISRFGRRLPRVYMRNGNIVYIDNPLTA